MLFFGIMDDLRLKSEELTDKLFEKYLLAKDAHEDADTVETTNALQKAKSKLADHLLVCKAMSKHGTAAILELSSKNPVTPPIRFDRRKISTIVKDISACGYLGEEVIQSFLTRLNLRDKVIKTLDLEEADTLLTGGTISVEQYEAILAIVKRKQELKADLKLEADLIGWSQDEGSGDRVDIKDF